MKYIHDKSKAKLVQRLRIIEGQIRGLTVMIENDTYCIDIITQTSAAKHALSNVENALLENHLAGCILQQVKAGQTKKAEAEILKIYKLKRK